MDLTPKARTSIFSSCCRPASDENDDDGYTESSSPSLNEKAAAFDLPSSSSENNDGPPSPELESLKQQVASLQKQLDEVCARRAEENNSMAQEIVDIKRERDDLSAEKDAMAQEIVCVKQERDGISAAKNSMAKEIVGMKRERDDLFAEKDAMQERIESLLNEAAENAVANAEEIEALQIELEETNSKKDDESKRLHDSLQKELDRVRSDLVSTASVRDGIVAENESLQQLVDALRKSISQVTADSEVVKMELDLAKVHIEGVEGDAKRLTQDLEERQARLEAAEKSAESLSAQLKALARERDELKEDAARALEEENESREVGRTELKEEAEHLEAMQCLELQKEDLIRRNKAMALRVQSLISQATVAKEEQMKESDDALDSISVESENLRKELESAQRTLQEKDGQDKTMKADIAEIAKQRDSFLVENESLQQEVSSLQNKISEISAAKSREVDNLHHEMDELLAEIDTLQHKIEEVTTSKQAEIDHLRKELHDVRSCLFDDTSNWDTPPVESDSSRQQVETLQRQIETISSSKESEITQLRQELEVVHTQLSDSVEEKTARLDELIEQKEIQVEMARQIENLTAEIECVNASAGQMQERLLSTIEFVESELASKESTASVKLVVDRLRKELGSLQMLASESAMKGSFVGSSEEIEAEEVESAQHSLSKPPAKPIIVRALSCDGLIVEFECTQDESDEQTSTLIARCINTNDEPIYGMNLQVAVPKYVTLHMKPPTPIAPDRTEDSSAKVVMTQTLRVTNSLIGKKNLMLKLKVGFTHKGNTIERVTTCTGFPAGQF